MISAAEILQRRVESGEIRQGVAQTVFSGLEQAARNGQLRLRGSYQSAGSETTPALPSNVIELPKPVETTALIPKLPSAVVVFEQPKSPVASKTHSKPEPADSKIVALHAPEFRTGEVTFFDWALANRIISAQARTGRRYRGR